MWSNMDNGRLDNIGTWTVAIRTMRRGSLAGFQEFQQVSPVEADDPDSPFTPTEAANLIVGLLFASHKNPSIGAAQCLLFLQSPDHADIADAVLNEVRDATTRVDYTHPLTSRSDTGLLAATPRLNACVYEALRLCSHSIGAIRKVLAPAGFVVSTARGGSYTVPHGAYIGISHIVPHLDKAVWGDEAASFRPFDNFGDIKTPPDDYAFTAFSHGVHRCPGRMLATLQMTVVLAIVLSRFDVTCPGKIPPLCFEKATLAQRAGPCQVQFSPRSR
eukprot:m.1295 g.1295  ORF g.1295 m.1295 type:complete len:274 (-) comp280_c1_seq1:155-976(-)